ncbi:MAG: hypothetical protein NT088_04160 [Candidatus Omnitrophica bacterium]|nr:hypothetical protein [Candidatus Omnitrophota bacterium]
MKEQKDFYQVVDEICAKDARYKPGAYEFVMQGLHFTQKRFKRQGHVKGQELAEGIRDMALEQFGPMVKTVFTHWGISRTEDFGNIVFNMINKKILSKTEEDSLGDFKDVYDFEAAFSSALRDHVKENGKI